jgi:SPP1 gp7 family putative phage head morphogenesis protein
MAHIPPGIRAIEAVGNRAIGIAIPEYKKQVNIWIKNVEDQMKDYDDIDKLKLTPLSEEIRNTINRTLNLSYLIGNGSANDDKEKEKAVRFVFSLLKKQAIDNFKKFEFAIITGIDWRIVGFPIAERLLAAKEIIPPGVFKKAIALLKSITFSVATLEDLNALLVIRKSLEKAIKTGVVFRDWLAGLDRDFMNAGFLAGPDLTAHHLETVFRTNQSSVYSISRFDNFRRDRNIEMIEFRAIIDDRTRDSHSALDEFRAKKNDSVWAGITPPLDYNCRCYTVPITIFRAKKRGLQPTKMNDKLRKALGDLPEEFQGKNTLFNLNKRLQKEAVKKTAEINI